MSEVNSSHDAKHAKKSTAAMQRRSTRVDLTPMVDLGFLLITFFVFTTSMTRPKVMNMYEPIDSVSRFVRKSGAMTLIVAADRKIYYHYSITEELSAADLHVTDLTGIRQLIIEHKHRTEKSKLMYIIKAASKSTFGDNIDMLNEMTICGIEGGHYAEAGISESEARFLDALRQNE